MSQSLRVRQNCRHFADDIFKRIFVNEGVRISLKISLKFVPQIWINDIPSLVQIMAWRRPGNNPLFEPMMDSLPTHICITRPQWVRSLRLRQNRRHFAVDISKCIFLNEDVRISLKIWLKIVPKVWINDIPALVQIIAWRRSSDKPLSEPVIVCLLTDIYASLGLSGLNMTVSIYF